MLRGTGANKRRVSFKHARRYFMFMTFSKVGAPSGTISIISARSFIVASGCSDNIYSKKVRRVEVVSRDASRIFLSYSQTDHNS